MVATGWEVITSTAENLWSAVAICGEVLNGLSEVPWHGQSGGAYGVSVEQVICYLHFRQWGFLLTISAYSWDRYSARKWNLVKKKINWHRDYRNRNSNRAKVISHHKHFCSPFNLWMSNSLQELKTPEPLSSAHTSEIRRFFHLFLNCCHPCIRSEKLFIAQGNGALQFGMWEANSNCKTRQYLESRAGQATALQKEPWIFNTKWSGPQFDVSADKTGKVKAGAEPIF